MLKWNEDKIRQSGNLSITSSAIISISLWKSERLKIDYIFSKHVNISKRGGGSSSLFVTTSPSVHVYIFLYICKRLTFCEMRKPLVAYVI